MLTPVPFSDYRIDWVAICQDGSVLRQQKYTDEQTATWQQERRETVKALDAWLEAKREERNDALQARTERETKMISAAAGRKIQNDQYSFSQTIS